MGIQSTVDLKREFAINRITEIQSIIIAMEYQKLEEITNEQDYDLQDFIDNYEDIIPVHSLKNYTNKMLENIIDTPFFRFSMFENYSIVD